MPLEPSGYDLSKTHHFPVETISGGLSVEHKYGHDLKESNKDELKTFLANELFLSHQSDISHEERERRLDSTFNNAFAVDYFDYVMKNHSRSVISLVRDENHTLIGTCTTIITEENNIRIGESTLMGLGINYQHKNVGSEVFKKHIDILRQEGVVTTQAHAWEDSKRMLDKTGIPYTVAADDPMDLTIQVT